MIWNERIKELREEHNLTQSQIAESLNITQRAVSYYERNQREIPIEILVRYATFFDVSLEYICGLSDNTKES